MNCEKIKDFSIITSNVRLSYKSSSTWSQKINIKSKIMNCVFIGYTYNSGACWFFIHKLNIDDIHPNTIMESRMLHFLMFSI